MTGYIPGLDRAMAFSRPRQSFDAVFMFAGSTA